MRKFQNKSVVVTHCVLYLLSDSLQLWVENSSRKEAEGLWLIKYQAGLAWAIINRFIRAEEGGICVLAGIKLNRFAIIESSSREMSYSSSDWVHTNGVVHVVWKNAKMICANANSWLIRCWYSCVWENFSKMQFSLPPMNSLYNLVKSVTCSYCDGVSIRQAFSPWEKLLMLQITFRSGYHVQFFLRNKRDVLDVIRHTRQTWSNLRCVQGMGTVWEDKPATGAGGSWW